MAYDQKRLHGEKLVAETVGKLGYKTATPSLPLKLLSVHSGLAEYGRNNIAYVKGMGSFLRLTAVYSNMPCENDQWQEAKIMEPYQECPSCQKACPTGAIANDRFLLYSEKCLHTSQRKRQQNPFSFLDKT